jgi:hypothetical protein
MGKKRYVYRSSVRTSEGKTLLGELSIDKRIILKWMKEVGCIDVALDSPASG